MCQTCNNPSANHEVNVKVRFVPADNKCGGEKAIVSAVAASIVLLLYIGAGGFWLKGHFFPAIEDRLHLAESAQHALERNLADLDTKVRWLEDGGAKVLKGEANADNLRSLGDEIREVQQKLSDSNAKLKEIDSAVLHLETSDQVDIRLSGNALEKFAVNCHGKLEGFTDRVDTVTTAAGEKVPKR
jgi:hypothetical protein